MKCFKELNQLKTLYFGFVWLIFDCFSSLDWLVVGSDPCQDQYKRGGRNTWLAEQGEKGPTSASTGSSNLIVWLHHSWSSSLVPHEPDLL